MASTSETGHPINIANFETIISICTAYGTSYNPSKSTIKIAAMNTTLTASKNAQASKNIVKATYDTIGNARDSVFKAFDKLLPRVMNAAASSNIPTNAIEDVKTVYRKLQGRRPPKGGSKSKESTGNELPENAESPKSNSSSQMSFDNRIENFDKLIQLLAAQTGYIPNEADLKITALTAFLNDMKAKNLAETNSATTFSNSLIARNNLLYAKETGIVAVAGDVKKYIKSVFGASSPQYKQVSGIKFKNIKS